MLKTEGIVLSEMRYRDTSKILNIYTKKHGKIHVMARGAYRPKSAIIASTQPFSQSEYLFNKGRNFYYLNQASLINPFYDIRKDLDRFLYGSYILELMDKSTLEEESSQKLYLLLLKGLETLSSLERDFQKFFIAFGFKYISFLGYRPSLSSCAHCGNSLNGKVKFSLMEGGLICVNCFTSDLSAKNIDKYMVDCMIALLYTSLDDLEDIDIDSRSLRKLQSIIEEYILYNIDRKDFNSLKILNSLK